jgi:hypothetical protein
MKFERYGVSGEGTKVCGVAPGVEFRPVRLIGVESGRPGIEVTPGSSPISKSARDVSIRDRRDT